MRVIEWAVGHATSGVVAAALLVGAVVDRAAAQAAAIPTGPPVFVSAERILSPKRPGKPANAAPEVPVLSPADRAALDRAVRELPRFPVYYYSGCDDRAHAAYLLLPQALREKAAKVWLFAPSRYTPALVGTLGLRAPAPGTATAQPVGWGYHVALAFRGGGDSLFVYDAVLAPDRLLTRDVWFGQLTIPTASIWTLLPGRGYSFNGVEVAAGTVDGARSPNRFPFNGWVFPDSGLAGRVARNLGRDAVGQAILRGQACQAPVMRDSVANADGLLSMLVAGKAPADCQQIYREARDLWDKKLPPAAPAPAFPAPETAAPAAAAPAARPAGPRA